MNNQVTPHKVQPSEWDGVTVGVAVAGVGDTGFSIMAGPIREEADLPHLPQLKTKMLISLRHRLRNCKKPSRISKLALMSSRPERISESQFRGLDPKGFR